MSIKELDVRPLRKPDKHPTIFAAYRALQVGEAIVLINDHDPKHLYSEFVAEYAGGFGWEYQAREPRNWRIRITKLASTSLPRVLLNTAVAPEDTAGSAVAGAAWKLNLRERDLDSNLIVLPPDGEIDRHAGASVDVLLHVTAGSGRLLTELGELQLEPGSLVWLPRGSLRQFRAGAQGLQYLTVHQRRQALVLEPTSQRSNQTSPPAAPVA